LEHLLNQFYEGFIEDDVIENEEAKKVRALLFSHFKKIEIAEKKLKNSSE